MITKNPCKGCTSIDNCDLRYFAHECPCSICLVKTQCGWQACEELKHYSEKGFLDVEPLSEYEFKNIVCGDR